MPVHLSTKWLVTKNLQFSYFTRYDSFAHKDLEHLFQVNYKKNRNSFATFHLLETIPILITKIFIKKRKYQKKFEQIFFRKKSFNRPRNPFESQVIGKGIDEVWVLFIKIVVQ